MNRNQQENVIFTQIPEATYYDKNIQLPAVFSGFRIPGVKTRESKVLEFISTYLSDGKSSKLYKKLVDEKKMALQIGAFNYSQEDHSLYFIYGLPMGTNSTADMLKEIDEEILKMQTELISEKDYQKLQNKFENQYVNSNANVEGVADNLATYYLLYGDINLINTEIDIYRSITREEIKEVANKYLKSNQRLILDYVPTAEKTKK